MFVTTLLLLASMCAVEAEMFRISVWAPGGSPGQRNNLGWAQPSESRTAAQKTSRYIIYGGFPDDADEQFFIDKSTGFLGYGSGPGSDNAEYVRLLLPRTHAKDTEPLLEHLLLAEHEVGEAYTPQFSRDSAGRLHMKGDDDLDKGSRFFFCKDMEYAAGKRATGVFHLLSSQDPDRVVMWKLQSYSCQQITLSVMDNSHMRKFRGNLQGLRGDSKKGPESGNAVTEWFSSVWDSLTS